ncbi:unnamed protein product, partial [Choristocarpus tenellus]
MTLRLAVKKFVDRQPIATMSIMIGTFGVSLPFIVPPIREKLGYPTNQ